jgi:hypothetical protein
MSIVLKARVRVIHINVLLGRKKRRRWEKKGKNI